MNINLNQRLDFSRVITFDKLDRETYDNKFKLLAQAKSTNDNELYAQLLNDDTIYSYELFYDDTGSQFKYQIYQDAIANLHHDMTNDNPNRFILFVGSNQIGKSRVLINKAIKLVSTKTNINIIMVSKSLPQSQFLLASIKHSLNNSKFTNWREDLGDTANTTVMTFQRDDGKTINRIICAPCGEGLLGYPVHYLFLDELDFYDEAQRFFWGIALPRTNYTKGQIIAFSNPNWSISRSKSILWDLYNGDLFKRKFHFHFMDNDKNTIEEYERLKKSMPSFVAQSVLDGQFPIEAGAFFKQSELDRNLVKEWDNILPFVDSPVYMGLDLGKVNDNSVLSLGTVEEVDGIMHLKVKYIEVFEIKTDYRDVVARLHEIYIHYRDTGVGGIGLDTTGVGRAVQEFVMEKNIPHTDITWSFEMKTKLFGDFKLLMENDRIKIVYTDEVYHQMANLIFKSTPKGYLTYSNKKDTDHDDIPSSIAMLINVAIKPSFIMPSISLLR